MQCPVKTPRFVIATPPSQVVTIIIIKRRRKRRRKRAIIISVIKSRSMLSTEHATEQK
jgi:hypothetical protein